MFINCRGTAALNPTDANAVVIAKIHVDNSVVTPVALAMAI